MNKDFVVDERWKVTATQSEPDVTLACRVQQVRLASVNRFEKFKRVTFSPEVDQVLIVPVDPHVSERPPCSLDLLCGHGVLGLQLHFFLALQEATPGPLDLNGGYVIHRKPVVLEQPPSQGHLVSGLDDGCAEVTQALVFVSVSHVERTGQELLPQLLSCSEVEALIVASLHDFVPCDLHQLERVVRRLTHLLAVAGDLVHLFELL